MILRLESGSGKSKSRRPFPSADRRRSAVDFDKIGPAPTRGPPPARGARRRGWSAGGNSVLDSWVRRLEILFFLSQSRMKSYAHDRLLGFLWWILDPLFQIGIYVILMEHIIKTSQPRYPLFLACAVIPWRFLAHGSSSAGTSILANSGLLKSINIDRIFMPLSDIINSLVYFLYALPTLLALMLFYRIAPTFHLLWIPLIVVVLFMLVAGLGLLLSVGMVYLRDAEYLCQFILYA